MNDNRDINKRKKELYKQISVIAKRHILKNGYTETNIDNICKECKISKKTFYEIFDSKEDLLFFLSERDFLNGLHYLQEQFPEKNMTGLRAVLLFFIEFIKKDTFRIRSLGEFNSISAKHIRKRYPKFIDSLSYSSLMPCIEEMKRTGVCTSDISSSLLSYSSGRLILSCITDSELAKEKNGYIIAVLTRMIFDLLQIRETP